MSETTPLLPPPTTAAQAPFLAQRVRRSLSADDDDCHRSSAFRRWAPYVLVLLVGLGAGFGAATAYNHVRGRKDDGPMVPPVSRLPPPTGLPRNPAYLLGPGRAAVASEEKTCSELGLTILRDKNGTAVDAAITTTLCIGLLNAFSSGIGGGGFALVSLPKGQSYDTEADVADDVQLLIGDRDKARDARVVAIDFRETAPAAATKDMYKDAGRYASQVGGLAVGTPGELRGLERAHAIYGKVDWADLVLPVAHLARQFQVSRELARRIRYFGGFMLADPAWADVYAPTGQLAIEGDWISRPTYAATLETIAKKGAGALYEGEIAEDIIDTVKARGGILTHKDLQGYKERVYPAISGSFAGQDIYTTDAPGSGGVMLGMLNILDGLAHTHNRSACWDELSAHHTIEAMKFAFGARSEVTDPKFATNLTRLAEFRTKAWADEQRRKITYATHGPGYYGLVHDTPLDHGTTHLSVVDQWGGAASVTSTVNLIWGSHVMCPKTGIILNDEQDDFAVPGVPDAFGLQPSPWNYPAPGKRPLSSTAPSVVFDKHGDLRAVLGGSGGSRIFPSVAQVLLNLACGDDISAAVERPRLHNQVSPGITTLEVGPERPADAWLAALKARNHTIGQFDINVGASEVQAVLLDKHGRVFAASDSRKNGIAAAY
ncbi:hypothetical protein Q8F55_003900 [Vanrija albida]|uniref:Glutathione hydrolase n=1 Tax=Vanrija albida TaxID=181172 RepID=A0ABR3Q587_9TREE